MDDPEMDSASDVELETPLNSYGEAPTEKLADVFDLLKKANVEGSIGSLMKEFRDLQTELQQLREEQIRVASSITQMPPLNDEPIQQRSFTRPVATRPQRSAEPNVATAMHIPEEMPRNVQHNPYQDIPIGIRKRGTGLDSAGGSRSGGNSPRSPQKSPSHNTPFAPFSNPSATNSYADRRTQSHQDFSFIDGDEDYQFGEGSRSARSSAGGVSPRARNRNEPHGQSALSSFCNLQFIVTLVLTIVFILLLQFVGRTMLLLNPDEDDLLI